MRTSHQTEFVPITVLSIRGATSLNFSAENSISISLLPNLLRSRIEPVSLLFFFQAKAPFLMCCSLKLPFCTCRKYSIHVLSRTHALFSSLWRWTYSHFLHFIARPLLESDPLEVGIRFVMSEPAQRDHLHSWTVQRIILMPAHGRW